MIKVKRKLKKKWIKLLTNILLVLFVIIFSISTYKIYMYINNQNNIKDELNTIKDKSTITKVKDNKNTEVLEEDANINDPYWKYINYDLMNVNFNELKSINKDVKGWIKVKGTNINYPFVQTNNNSYYLNHSFDKSYNVAGWVFLDYRNNTTNNKNTILYAHGMKNNTMFGSLKNILNSNWLDNINNHVILLSTENENTLWQVFSIYHIPTTSDYLKTSFSSNEEFKEFINTLINRSVYNFNTTVSVNDKILTLSTCYSNTERIVLHAKLIKKETK